MLLLSFRSAPAQKTLSTSLARTTARTEGFRGRDSTAAASSESILVPRAFREEGRDMVRTAMVGEEGEEGEDWTRERRRSGGAVERRRGEGRWRRRREGGRRRRNRRESMEEAGVLGSITKKELTVRGRLQEDGGRKRNETGRRDENECSGCVFVKRRHG